MICCHNPPRLPSSPLSPLASRLSRFPPFLDPLGFLPRLSRLPPLAPFLPFLPSRLLPLAPFLPSFDSPHFFISLLSPLASLGSFPRLSPPSLLYLPWLISSSLPSHLWPLSALFPSLPLLILFLASLSSPLFPKSAPLSAPFVSSSPRLSPLPSRLPWLLSSPLSSRGLPTSPHLLCFLFALSLPSSPQFLPPPLTSLRLPCFLFASSLASLPLPSRGSPPSPPSLPRSLPVCFLSCSI